MLHALAACLTAGLANIAAARGVNLTEVESTVEGDIDLLGILGLSDEVRNGYEQIRVSFKVKGDDPEKLRQVVEQSRQRSAVFDIVTNGVPGDRRGRGRLSPPPSPPAPGAAEPAAGPACQEPTMRTTDTIIIGAGQAGLAISRCLTDAGADHVVLERGRLAERWRSERWDSLRLLTPNWVARLPGWQYQGDDPDGYMTAGRARRYFERYAALLRRAGRTRARPCSSLRRDGDAFSRHDRRGRLARRPASSSPPAGATARTCPAPPRALAPRSPSSRPAPTATPTSCPTAACSSSAPRPPASRSPTSSPAPDAHVALAVGSHTRMPAPLPRASTSSGGWTDGHLRPRPSTRCPTPSRRGGSRRCSWSAGPTAATSTW